MYAERKTLQIEGYGWRFLVLLLGIFHTWRWLLVHPKQVAQSPHCLFASGSIISHSIPSRPQLKYLYTLSFFKFATNSYISSSKLRQIHVSMQVNMLLLESRTNNIKKLFKFAFYDYNFPYTYVINSLEAKYVVIIIWSDFDANFNKYFFFKEILTST